jgi:hypothetical protein
MALAQSPEDEELKADVEPERLDLDPGGHDE